MPPRRDNDVEGLSLTAAQMMEEVGSTGLRQSGGYIYEEFLKELRGRNAVKVYREMRDNDPVVGAVIYTIDNLIRQVEWRVDPAEGEPEAEEDAEFLRQCKEDMEHTWGDLISEVLSMLTFGWSFHEPVYKRRRGFKKVEDPDYTSRHNDGKIGWAKIPIRAQETLLDWVIDEDSGEVLGMKQLDQYAGKGQVTIPFEKGLLFRTRVHKGNPEGRSLLRNAYRPWFLKKHIEEIEAIGIERDLAGLPMAWVPEEILRSDADEDEKAILQAFRDIIRNVRRDEQDGLILPLAYDENGRERYRFQLLSAGGARTFNIDQTVQRYDQRILMSVLMDFLLLGSDGVGSYALATSKTGIFRRALKTILDAISEPLNRHEIPRLFRLNGMEREKYPSIVPGEIDPPDFQRLAQTMAVFASIGMPFFPHEPTQNYLREIMGLPQLEENETLGDQNPLASLLGAPEPEYGDDFDAYSEEAIERSLAIGLGSELGRLMPSPAPRPTVGGAVPNGTSAGEPNQEQIGSGRGSQ